MIRFGGPKAWAQYSLFELIMKKLPLKNYHRIYIFGAPGSGKTTLAKKLSKQLKYPHFETDVIKWNHQTRQRRPEAERDARLNKIFTENKTWVIEGAQWKDWTNPVWRKCDAVIFCNPPTVKRVFYILKRYFLRQESGKKRISVRDTWNIIRYTLQFNKKVLPVFRMKTELYKKTVITFP